MGSIKATALSSIVWKAIETFAKQGVSFVIGVLLARILMPSDYGLIGMLAVIFAFCNLFIASGFSQALIQKIDRDNTDYSTVFYFNLAISILFYIVIYIGAPQIAEFFNQPALIQLSRVLSLGIIIHSLTIVQETRLTITFNFKALARATIISSIVSGPIGVVAAYNGFGVWALVIQSLTASLVRTLSLFFMSRWVPGWCFSIKSLRKMFGFGSKLLASGFIGVLFNNMYSLLIGKVFAAKELGFYTRAKTYPELLSNTTSAILQSSAFAILASLQNDRDKFIQFYRRIMGVTVFFVVPIMTMFALTAEPFVRLLLTEKWMPAVPLIQWLCLARVVTPMSTLNLNVLNATGRSDLFLRVDTAKIPLALIAVVITIPMGLEAVVIGHAVTAIIAYFFNTYYPGKLFSFGAFRQIYEMRLVLVATAGMSIFTYGLGDLLGGDFLKLVVAVPLGFLFYFSLTLLLKVKEATDVVAMVGSRIARMRGLA